MKLVRLDSLFKVINGYPTHSIKNYFIEEINDIENYFEVFIPSQTKGGSISGNWVSKDTIDSKYIFPVDTLYVSTDGAGSHTYSYVSNKEFVPCSNVAVLIPKEELTLQEKLYYAKCITKNRYKFNYGRKPKGERLTSLMLPAREEIPQWVHDTIIPDYISYKEPKIKLPEEERLKLWENINWGTFRLLDYFQSFGGQLLTKRWCEENPGNINFITSTTTNNGVNLKVNAKAALKENVSILKNVISVSTNGRSCWAFYQTNPCIIGLDAVGLIPKIKMTTLQSLFVCKMIRKEAFRFNYGRKLNTDRLEKLTIGLPMNSEGQPDWDSVEILAQASNWTNNL